MVVLKKVLDNGYLLADSDNIDDELLLSEPQIALCIAYGITIEGIKLNSQNKVHKAVPRVYEEDKDEKARIFEHYKKLGYVYSETDTLADAVRNILDAVVLENKLLEGRIDRNFVKILREVYPTLTNILNITYYKNGGYDENTKVLNGFTYKSKDMFYQYPEFAKIVNTGSLLALLGSFKEYYKYTDNRVIYFGGAIKGGTYLSYMEDCDIVLKFEKETWFPYDRLGYTYSTATLIADVTELDLDQIEQLLWYESKKQGYWGGNDPECKVLRHVNKVLIPQKYEDYIKDKKKHLNTVTRYDYENREYWTIYSGIMEFV